MEDGAGPINFLNLEFFFRLLYNSRPGGPEVPSVDSFGTWFVHFWSTLAAVSFVFSLVALGFLVYASVRMYQEKQKLHHLTAPLDVEEAEKNKDHSRWAHIQSLIESMHERDWREAIMEADIMLEDALAERGYIGETIAERLKNIDEQKLASINEAWEAHKVRNRIAHEGIAYKIEDHLAYRTIKKYERVFKELGEII
jgi:hypothetical protein